MNTTDRTNPYRWYWDKDEPSVGIEAKVDLHYAYKFHNRFTFEIKKGDIVYLIAPDGFNQKEYCWWAYSIVLKRNGKLIHPHHHVSFRQLTYPSFMYSSKEYSIEYCNEVIENFILQLEGKLPCVDLVYENQVFPNLNTGDSIVMTSWDIGLKFVNIYKVDGKNITGNCYGVFYKGEGLPWKEAETVTLNNYWLCKYGYIVENYDPTKPINADKIFSELINSDFEKNLFEVSLNKIV